MKRLFVCVIGFAMALILSAALAQDTPPAPAQIIVGQSIAQFQWLSEGQNLKVIDGIFVGQERQELTYQVALDSLDRPIVTSIADTTDLLINGNVLINNDSSLIYVAPNGQFAVSAAQQLPEQQYYLTIQHLPTGRIQVLRDIHIDGAFSAAHFRVRWSEDSSAFYVSNSHDPITYWHYVSDFTYVLEDVSAVLLNDQRDKVIVNQAIGEVAEVFDIDPEGEIVLLRRNTRIEDKPGVVAQLVTLNMKTLQYDILITSTSSIAGARFGRKGQIYYINAQGLSVYDLVNDTSQVLDSSITSNWAITAEISPGAVYVAATERGEPDTLYIIPVTP